MTIFAKPPLVELIVELKWGDASPFESAIPGQVVQGFFQADSSKHEEFLMRFGGECYSRGFQSSERLTPPGFPQIPGQVVCRFRNNTDGRPDLLQVGTGVFTANALPPYKGWAEFRPHLETGLECLAGARTPQESSAPFTSVAVRYINAFGSEYLQNLSQAEILRKLNFAFKLPDAISSRVQEDSSTNVALNYGATLSDGGRLTVVAGSGHARNEPAVLFDISIAYSNIMVHDVLSVIEQAHSLLDDIFLSSTEPFHSIMQERG